MIIYLTLSIIVIGLFLLFYYLYFKKKIMIKQKKACINCKNCIEIDKYEYTSVYGCTNKFKSYAKVDYIRGTEEVIDSALNDEYFFGCGRNRCYNMYGTINCHYEEKEEE